MAPITVDQSSVREHLARRKDEVASWRRRLWSSLESSVMSWPGYRVREQSRLYQVALDGVEGSTGSERRHWTALAASIIQQVGAEIARYAPREVAHSHLHLHGGDDAPMSQLTAQLGSKLSELANAGLLDEAATLLTGGTPDTPPPPPPPPIETSAARTAKSVEVKVLAPESKSA